MTVTLLTRSNVRDICRALHITPTKTLGQNFVFDGGTVRKIVAAAAVKDGEHVLEVGPGLGSLTLGLLAVGARVSAVEIDPLLATALPGTVLGHGGRELRVLEADAISVRSVEHLNRAVPICPPDPHSPGHCGRPNWDPPTKLVANLPYNVAVPLVLSVLEYFPSITELLVMVQTEVAQRMAAQPGGKIYGVPSVKIAWYGQARGAGAISRNVFWPTPHVDSSLVRITRWPTDNQLQRDQSLRPQVFALIDRAFAQRRKTLRAALKPIAGTGEDAARWLQAAGIDPLRRGETLTVEDFIALARLRVNSR